MPTVAAIALGGGAALALWLVLRAPSAPPPPCGIPISSGKATVTIPCALVGKALTEAKKVAVGSYGAVKAVVTTPYSIIAGQPKLSLFGQATGTVTGGLTVHQAAHA